MELISWDGVGVGIRKREDFIAKSGKGYDSETNDQSHGGFNTVFSAKFPD